MMFIQEMLGPGKGWRSPHSPLRQLAAPWIRCAGPEAATPDLGTDHTDDNTGSPPGIPLEHPLYQLAGDLMRNPVCMGLVSLPVLVGIAGGRQMAQGLDQLGTWGEELFRGDRLPLLPHPSDPGHTSSNQSS